MALGEGGNFFHRTRRISISPERYIIRTRFDESVVAFSARCRLHFVVNFFERSLNFFYCFILKNFLIMKTARRFFLERWASHQKNGLNFDFAHRLHFSLVTLCCSNYFWLWLQFSYFCCFIRLIVVKTAHGTVWIITVIHRWIILRKGYLKPSSLVSRKVAPGPCWNT